jgi:hypothetical protein
MGRSYRGGLVRHNSGSAEITHRHSRASGVEEETVKATALTITCLLGALVAFGAAVKMLIEPSSLTLIQTLFPWAAGEMIYGIFLVWFAFDVRDL